MQRSSADTIERPMKAVVLLRHGKSDWDAEFDDDLGRPLATRGRRSAAAVGRFLATVDRVPDLVLCSPATRSRETAELAIEAGAWTCPMEPCDVLYHGGPTDIAHMLAYQDDDIDVVMLVGHEPTSSATINMLVGGGRHRMPTAGLARIRFEADRWADVRPLRGRLEWLVPSRLVLAVD